MTIQTPANVYTQGGGTRPENVEIPIVSNFNPSSSQTIYPVGKRWINQASNAEYVLTSYSSSMGSQTANWTGSSGAGLQILAAGVTPAMVGGTLTVTNPAITSSSVVVVSAAVQGTALGFITVPPSGIVNGSFVIQSSSPSDTSSFWYVVAN